MLPLSRILSQFGGYPRVELDGDLVRCCLGGGAWRILLAGEEIF